MSFSPRIVAPLLLVLCLSCKGKDSGNGNPDVRVPTLDIPEQWQSKEAAVVMRISNVSSTSTEVRRALNELANGNPLDPNDNAIDPLHLLMRLPETDEAGMILEPDTSLATAEKLAGSAVEQAVAFREKIIDGDGQPFEPEEAQDACGNPMIMSVLSPHAIQAAIPAGAQEQDFWSQSCPDGLDCQTIEPGSWDVALGEMRFDGMIDMVINLFPDLRVDPVRPGAFGHLTALFLTTNNPGTLAAPLIANMRRVQINLTGVWELEEVYVDPLGYHEVFKFPHRSRELTEGDVFVFLEGYEKGTEYWGGKYPDQAEPSGLEGEWPVTVDVTAPAGDAIVKATGGAEDLNQLLQDALVHQIGAAISCPSVRETQWVRKGPVEFFLCPGVDLSTCVATEDLEEGACAQQTEPAPSITNPFPEGFSRVQISGPGVNVPVLASKQPYYLATPAEIGTVLVDIQVDASTTIVMKDSSRIIAAATTATGLPVELPDPEAPDHCTAAPLQKIALGQALEPGAYTLTVDLSAGVDFETDLLTGDSLLWFYLSSVDTWKQRN